MPIATLQFRATRGCGAVIIAGVLSLIHDPLFANPAASGATAQTAGPKDDQASPANVVTGADFQRLMKIMRRNIVACGAPRTAVLHWHVGADGVIDDFVLNKSSGDACFDEIVILNAETVVSEKLRATPAMRSGIPEPAWVPFAVAARD